MNKKVSLSRADLKIPFNIQMYSSFFARACNYVNNNFSFASENKFISLIEIIIIL